MSHTADWPLLREGVGTVSFDIFDTLLHRKVKAPVDVFELVRVHAFGEDIALRNYELLDAFPEHRRLSEAGARQQRSAQYGAEAEITLEEIYAFYRAHYGAPAELADWLMRAELEMERKVLFRSHQGWLRYEAARSKGLPIAFISDMYLPEDWLRGVLEDAGYEGAGAVPLFVSGAERVSKGSGALFNTVAQRLGWEKNAQWLHVGDNRHADVDVPRKIGLSVEHADWSEVKNVPTVCSGGGLAGNAVKSLCEFLQTKQAQSLLPDDPFERIGYRIWGPALLGYTLWLISRAEELRLNKLIFVARDGYLLKQIYEMVQPVVGSAPAPQMLYFLFSRKVAYLTGIREWDTWENWNLIGSRVPRSVSQLFANSDINAADFTDQLKACGINDIEQPLPTRRQGDLKSVYDTLFTAVLLKNAENRKRFRSYYEDVTGKDGRTGFVDVGWGGNIQRCLINSISDWVGKSDVSGLYFGINHTAGGNIGKGYRIGGWLADGPGESYWEKLFLDGGIELMEFILSADGGSTVGLSQEADGRVTPVQEQMTESEETYRALARRAQRGVLSFVRDNLDMLSMFRPQALDSRIWAEPYRRMVMQPRKEELDLLAGITHSDAPGTNSQRMQLAWRAPLHVRLSRRKLRKLEERSFWRAGFRALNRFRRRN